METGLIIDFIDVCEVWILPGYLVCDVICNLLNVLSVWQSIDLFIFVYQAEQLCYYHDLYCFYYCIGNKLGAVVM